MHAAWKRIGLVGLVAGLTAVVVSCEVPQQYKGDLVETVITRVAADGKTCEVNVGAFDGLHGGKTLWVVRGKDVVALLSVTKLRDYSADCLVNVAPSTILKPKAGDRVARQFRDVTSPANLRSRVPRMVPVPHPDNVVIITTGGFTNPTDIEIAVPRDQYETWKKQYENGTLKFGP